MKTSIKALLMISGLTFSFVSFAHAENTSKDADQGKGSMSHEMPGMGSHEKMGSMPGGMMKGMENPDLMKDSGKETK